jgi:hypothetical protein
MTYLLACNLVVQHIISCNWVLPVGNIFIYYYYLLLLLLLAFLNYYPIVSNLVNRWRLPKCQSN